MRYDHGSEPYREKRLHLAALSWAHDHLGYRAIADDVEAKGDPMDAIGMLGDELVLIETKPDIDKGTVRFNPKVSGTIEPKIAKTLAALYRGETKGQVGVIADHWNRHEPLTIVILAGNYLPLGLEALMEMLHERAKEWRFHYRVWRWTGERIDELAHVATTNAPVDLNWASISVPQMIARPTRSPPAAMEELRATASRSGMLEVFDAILARSRDLKMRPTSRVTGINLHTRGKNQPSWCSIFVTENDHMHGFNCGIEANLFAPLNLPLPGLEAPQVGYMNTNRFIRSHADIAALFAPFD